MDWSCWLNFLVGEFWCLYMGKDGMDFVFMDCL